MQQSQCLLLMSVIWKPTRRKEDSPDLIPKNDGDGLLLRVAVTAVTEPRHPNGDEVRTAPERCAMHVACITPSSLGNSKVRTKRPQEPVARTSAPRRARGRWDDEGSRPGRRNRGGRLAALPVNNSYAHYYLLLFAIPKMRSLIRGLRLAAGFWRSWLLLRTLITTNMAQKAFSDAIQQLYMDLACIERRISSRAFRPAQYRVDFPATNVLGRVGKRASGFASGDGT